MDALTKILFKNLLKNIKKLTINYEEPDSFLINANVFNKSLQIKIKIDKKNQNVKISANNEKTEIFFIARKLNENFDILEIINKNL